MIVGALGTRHRASVRPGGRIVLREGTDRELSLQWWVGADDRWHDPANEITARQSLIRELPIVISSVRIPSGDAVATAFTTVQGPRELVVAELDNRSKVPFAGALVVSGPGAIDLRVVGATIEIDGRPVVHLPNSPQRISSGPSIDAVRENVFRGAAASTAPFIAGTGCLAALFPVTHGTAIRVATLLDSDSVLAGAAAPVLGALPRAHDVANGWDSHLDRGIVFRSFPPLSAPAFRTALASLLLQAEPAASERSMPIVVAAVMARALDGAGFSVEAGALLERVIDSGGRRGSISDADSDRMVGHSAIATAFVIDAVARHGALTHNAVFAEALEPTIAGGMEFVLKAARSRTDLEPYVSCLESAAAYFRVARDERAAKQVTKIRSRSAVRALPDVDLPPLPALSRGGNIVPEDPLRLAAIVRTHTTSAVEFSSDEAVVVKDFSDLGHSVDVRNAPTPWGRLSFALRWHGDRAALLWECTAIHDDQCADDLVLRFPRFAGWTGRGSRGEALLPRWAVSETA